MKKSIFYLVFTLSFAIANSQTQLSLRLGATYLTDFSKLVCLGPGLSYQFCKKNNIAIGFNFDYRFGASTMDNFSFKVAHFEPRLDYYIKTPFEGFHVGPALGLAYLIADKQGATTTYTYLALSGSAGYSLIPWPNTPLDFSLSLGLNMDLNTNKFQGGIRPVLSLGTRF